MGAFWRASAIDSEVRPGNNDWLAETIPDDPIWAVPPITRLGLPTWADRTSQSGTSHG